MKKLLSSVLMTTAFTACAYAADPTTLRQTVGDRMLIGTAVLSYELSNRHGVLVGEQFNCVTPGNEFKPDALQKEKGVFTFDRADKIAAFAKQHDMKLVGHTLLWHNQTPAWLFQGADKKPLPREEALANLKTHITTVVQHFKGQVIGWDVVNEGISDSKDEYLRDTPARKAIGDDYIAQAFRFAHDADPDVKLYYNDYNIENPGKREKAIRLIRELKSAGVHVDGVGIQGHWLMDYPQVQVVEDAINEFSALGVDVMVTEMDIDVLPRRTTGAEINTREAGADPYKDGLPDDMQKKLAVRYGAFFELFAKENKAGKLSRVTIWGTSDDHSWLNDFPVKGRTNHALLFDRNLKPKPAFDAAVKALSAGPAPEK